MALTEKQKIFADEYLLDLNATRAYKVAYPSCKKDGTAAAAGARLLRNVKVSAYISEQLEKLHSDRVADAQEVMEHLSAVMRGLCESRFRSRPAKGSGAACKTVWFVD